MQGFALAAELPGELLSAVATLRALAEKAGKAAKKADAPELAAKHRAFAGALPPSLSCCKLLYSSSTSAQSASIEDLSFVMPQEGVV